jgi:hypothetical protein
MFWFLLSSKKKKKLINKIVEDFADKNAIKE